MLTGVLTVSSARTKEGALSDDGCRDGVSCPEVPERLIGREKLNERRGGGAERSEQIEGDL